MKHTPGPWSYSCAKAPVDGAYDWAVSARQDGRRQVIAEAFGRTDWTVWPDAEANARLIAAAPELLDALRELLTAHSNENIGVNASMRRIKAKEQARVVIAKATGEPS